MCKEISFPLPPQKKNEFIRFGSLANISIACLLFVKSYEKLNILFPGIILFPRFKVLKLAI